MSIWNLHKKFQLSSAMGLRDFDLQSQPTLMGGNPLIVVQWVQAEGWTKPYFSYPMILLLIWLFTILF